MSRATITVTDPDALREHLDDLNQAGLDYRAVGVDANSSPFLAALAGPYAETIIVITGDPWDGEVDYGTGYHCDECNAANLRDETSIAYPATLFDTSAR